MCKTIYMGLGDVIGFIHRFIKRNVRRAEFTYSQ
jgi:hypothetical protein